MKKKESKPSKVRQAAGAAIAGGSAIVGTVVGGPAGSIVGTIVGVYYGEDIINHVAKFRRGIKNAMEKER